MWFSRFAYNFAIIAYSWGIQIAAIFGNHKARQWRDGRRGQWERIAKKMQQRNASKPLIWLHVASLGEFEQGRPIIESIKQRYVDWEILLTFFSPSGYEIRKNYPLADYIFYLPIDTQRNAQRFLRLTQPRLAIFVKYDFWYHYLATLKNKGITTLLIAAVFRQNQVFFQFYGAFFRHILTFFTHLFVQDNNSANLLQNIGIQNVSTVGDTRVDRVLTLAAAIEPNEMVANWLQNAPLIVCGSTWQADETLLATVFQHSAFEACQIIIAPHDIAAKNILRLQILFQEATCITYSELLKNPSAKAKVLIINNIGTLNTLYQYGEWAYIGGGFGRGIHNTLEPMAFGLPVVFGAKYQKFEEANQAIALGGAFSVSDSAACLSIFQKLQDADFRAYASAQVQQLLESSQGATQKILDTIFQ
jgi:3-deoxy-D-manno-octulosonic-acid transferase